MIQLQEKLATNTWVKADWDIYLSTIEFPDRENTKGYYYNGYIRTEDLEVVEESIHRSYYHHYRSQLSLKH